MSRGPAHLLKLNLGSGSHRLPGFLHVDKFGEPELRCDLEVFPWPWPDGSVREVLLNHVLEHLGGSADVYLGIMRELYRVCAPGALVRIRVPHPRHDHFLIDPTHVRPILAEQFEMFSLRTNQRWAELSYANTPLAIYLGVDFETVGVTEHLDDAWQARLSEGLCTEEELAFAKRHHFNVIRQVDVTLRVEKPGVPGPCHMEPVAPEAGEAVLLNQVAAALALPPTFSQPDVWPLAGLGWQHDAAEPSLLAFEDAAQAFYRWEDWQGSPPLVLAPYNPVAGPEPAVMVPRMDDFVWDGTSYFGASFQAMIRLGRARGYKPVWSSAFRPVLLFVREDLLARLPVELADAQQDPASLFRPSAMGRHPLDEQARPWLVIAN